MIDIDDDDEESQRVWRDTTLSLSARSPLTNIG